ncbi:MAG TPA: sxtJ [Gammaproteobacteria bacterium]|nr:sxtJ [Gammaproteobacteria bacterium]
MHKIPEPSNKDLRSFGLLTGIIAAVLFGLFFPWLLESETWPRWPWIVLGVLGGFGLLLPVVLKPVYYVWMYLGAGLGWVNTRIILGVIFYLLFTPIALVMWLLRKDPMRRRLDAGSSSYRLPSQKSEVKRMENPF